MAVTVLSIAVALVPGAIIVHHVLYLYFSRRQQFARALEGGTNKDEVGELEEVYFGVSQLALRYGMPALLATVLCYLVISALIEPKVSLEAFVGETRDVVWRGAALGFAGAYVYLLLLLTERGFRHDVTSGVAIWAAAMMVLGPITGGAANFLLGNTVVPGEPLTRDALLFVAGMLPRQFAMFIQAQARKTFQSGAAVVMRTVPLTTLRGVGADVQARLEEEGVHDVAALAYESPHRLIRATNYAPRQIADWIDEALLVTTVPDMWQAMQKVGITGGMDLAWYKDRPQSIAALATELKINETVLGDIVIRMWEDAQVQDLRKLYWDESLDSTPAPADKERAAATVTLAFRVVAATPIDGRKQLLADIKALPGVRAVVATGDDLRVDVESAQRDAVRAALLARPEIEQEAAIRVRFRSDIVTDARERFVAEARTFPGVRDVRVDGDAVTIAADARDEGVLTERLRGKQELDAAAEREAAPVK
jgi:hypothetical protein